MLFRLNLITKVRYCVKQNYREIQQAKKIIAQEEGVVLKNWGGKLPVALVWPNTYRVGMSSLALHILYRLFNDEPDVVCERVFFGDQQAPQHSDPIMSLESQRPLDEFGAVAFTVSYEMDYFNVIHMLRRAGFPLFAEERDENWPLLIGGGPAVYTNPEPLADIFDAFAIGRQYPCAILRVTSYRGFVATATSQPPNATPSELTQAALPRAASSYPEHSLSRAAG